MEKVREVREGQGNGEQRLVAMCSCHAVWRPCRVPEEQPLRELLDKYLHPHLSDPIIRHRSPMTSDPCTVYMCPLSLYPG